MTVILDEFEDTKISVSADGRGRVALGADVKNETFAVSRNQIGQILLTPIVTIPKHEVWLWRNQAALASVHKGLQEASAGESEAADLSQYADIEIED